nr:RNA-dependent RNA polymerase [Picobirnavirus green monkey/KNA/2015]
MPRNNETNSNGVARKFFAMPNPGLRSYFDIVKQGQPDEYRTPFAKGKKPQEVLKEWDAYLQPYADKWPALLEFENDLGSKVGPMSIMKPLEERRQDIEHYYTDISLQSRPIDERAVKAVIAEFAPLKGLRIRGQQHTVDQMKKSTNSGSPYFLKRKLVTDKTIPCTVFLGKSKSVYQKLPTGLWQAAAVLGWRGQEGGPSKDDVKQRVVWMFPYAVNIAELQVYQPLIEAAQLHNLVPAWVSMDAVAERITKMFDTKGKDDLVICTDFSKFDQHFNEDMSSCASQILSELLTPTPEAEVWLRTVFPIKYNIPLLVQTNEVMTGRHGMGSGSGGTNADETLSHRALQYESAILANSKLNPNSQCLGDDGVLTYPGITVEDVIRSYAAHGQEMNESKQRVSTHDCIYLRRLYDQDYRVDGICRGVYSTKRALGRLMEQERYFDPAVWSAEGVAMRQLSIIQNCEWHPAKEEFVQFCMKRDKYRLGLDIPGFLDNVDRIAKKFTDLMPDFLGYTKTMQRDRREQGSGMSDWWIVKYLKSLR